MMDRYLLNEGQSKINEDIKIFCNNIGEINKIEDLKIVDKVFYENFISDKTTPKFLRSVIEIFNSKTFSGCSDIGLMMSSILREKGIPTVYVETVRIDWLDAERNNRPEKELMMGHIFLEIFVNGKWYLYDPTFRLYYDNYDNTNNNYPRNFYVFAKDLNCNNFGIFNTKDERRIALERLEDFDVKDYINPNYKEIKIKDLI